MILILFMVFVLSFVLICPCRAGVIFFARAKKVTKETRSRRRADKTSPFGAPGAFLFMKGKIAWMQFLVVRRLDGASQRPSSIEKASARIERELGRVFLVTSFARAKEVTPVPAGAKREEKSRLYPQ